MKKLLVSTALCLFISIAATAQTSFEVPQNVVLETPADFTKYEADVINASKWLEETNLDKETEKRQDVNTFLLQWITGSPTVSVEINDYLGKIYGDNTQLLAIYLGSYSRHFLENKNSATASSATKAGIISMITVYKKGISIVKSKEMEKVIKFYDQNKLDEYLKNVSK
ncbi:hypothetical protein NAT51_12260 [Flavobacterium amniphilum]|uniref:hypothetical protein n=1 Tax=Flavobacterium amniphilum TaxID=1834035 RepID=UPI00202A2508|nr:hypothetical protein [Flavobacterium amniphilum]MCL9806302.1 hypothetical protein [Flavobacterium amniphilum]